MKRTFLLTLICILCTAFASQAQSGRAVDALFGGHYNHLKDVEEVMVRGGELKKYNLTLFRSLTVDTKTRMYIVRQMEKCVLTDSKNTQNSSMKWRDRHLQFCILSFPLADGNYAHILFKNKGKTAKLIYCEGKASLEQLQNSMMSKKIMFSDN